MIDLGKGEYAAFTWTWKGKKYRLGLTPQDVLIWARAVDEEGYPQVGVAWALLQRAAWLTTLGKPMSLGALVTAYAQPINPAWFPGGPKHEAEIARLERVGDTAGIQDEKARAARRPGKASKPWENISATTKKVITDILSGASKSPVVGAVHYWKTHGPDFATNQAAKPGLTLLDRGFGYKNTNVFFAEKGAESFGNLALQGSISNIAEFLNGSGKVIGLMALGFLAWKWFV